MSDLVLLLFAQFAQTSANNLNYGTAHSKLFLFTHVPFIMSPLNSPASHGHAWKDEGRCLKSVFLQVSCFM